MYVNSYWTVEQDWILHLFWDSLHLIWKLAGIFNIGGKKSLHLTLHT